MKHLQTKTFRRLLASALLCLAACGAARGQETTGNIVGQVTDQKGAAVAGATVTIADPQRGFTRTYTTGEDGSYTAAQLPVGTYTISVEAPGFRKFVQENVTINVNDRRPIDAVLEAGQVSEVVTVVGDEAPLVQESPTQQSLVNGAQVRQLPLNNRNFVQLATLSAGVTSSLPSQIGFGGLSVVSLSINGGRTSAINWLVDGARNVDTGSNLTLLTVPSVDAISEFTVLTSNYAPEFGRNGGGVINVVTRSGSNEFHGSLYEFHRNDALNARNPFQTTPIAGLNKSSGEPRFVPPLRYNDYGLTVGGPIYLPRFGEGGPAVYRGHDRSFFFFSQEWRKIRGTNTAVATVPTAAQRSGAAFGLTPDQIDPNARAILQYVPLPNEGTNRFRRIVPVAADFRQSIVRLDHNFNERWSITGRYIRDDFSRGDPGGNPFLDPFIIGQAAGTPYPSVAAQETSTPGDNFVVSVRTLATPNVINEAAFDFARNLIVTNFVGTGTRANTPGFTSPELFPSTLQGALPSITFTGATSNLQFTSPQNIENPSYTWRDNLTWVRGSHTLKFGAFYAREAKNENAGNALNGSYAFNGSRSGNDFKDFLLGLPVSYFEDQNEVRVQLRYNTLEFYAQDSWKVTPRLTVDYGARYSVYQNPTDVDDLLTAFRPDFYDPARAVSIVLSGPAAGSVVANSGDRFNGIIFAGDNSPYGRRVQSNRYNTLGPRVGFAYNVFGDGNTVLRGGFGVYYDRTLVGIVEQNAFVNPRVNSRVTIDNPLLADPGAGTSSTTIPALTLQSTGDPFEVPRTMQYSLAVQRQLFRNAVLEVAYVGTSGRNLLRLININQPLPGARAALTARLREAGTLTATQFAPVNAVRPFLGYGNIFDRRTEADSNYNSLQVTFNKRLSGGLQLGAVYTFSKNITEASTDRSDAPQDPYNPDLDRALSQFDRTHVFTTNFLYELPFLRGRTDALGTAFGGWQLSGIYTAQSGTPLTITQTISGATPAGSLAQFADPLGVGLGTSASITMRPNLVGDPHGSGSVTQWFNTAAFAPAFFSYGNAGRGIVRGPGINNWDISVIKNFRFTEDTVLQFRTEFFNAFNHPQYGNPGTAATFAPDPSAPAGSFPTRFIQTNPNFGVITTTRDPRIIQFGLKLNY
ncbi:MAG TPA: carboxypeptidase regulatory-like domain-containing protein [Pyrinomonadaceae bacterium]|nr:carboxypeptidase regulatory-like domain-containing protein [Pyrinomonadaceae bacterium]